jgi:NADPH-dependent curcumin reductase CurA
LSRPRQGQSDRVGQLAQLAGARAVGIAGGAAKCAHVRDELRFDAVVDHKARGLSKALAAACPDGIDVYFENVGGQIWNVVLPLLNRYARIPVCGLIAHYNGDAPAEPNSVAETMLAILRRSLLIRGFINTEFAPQLYRAFLSEITPLVHSGRIRYREHVVDGLEAAPQAFIGMLEGHNFGKTLVGSPDAGGRPGAPLRREGDSAGIAESAVLSSYQRHHFLRM